MTMNTLQQLAGLFLMALLTLGPVVVLMLLLNSRDRRRAALLDMMWQRAPHDLRDLISIQVCCSVFSRRTVVAVDMSSCSRDEIWEAIARWSSGLPAQVRLMVDGKMDHGLPASFTVQTAGRPPLCSTPRSSVAAG